MITFVFKHLFFEHRIDNVLFNVNKAKKTLIFICNPDFFERISLKKYGST